MIKLGGAKFMNGNNVQQGWTIPMGNNRQVEPEEFTELHNICKFLAILAQFAFIRDCEVLSMSFASLYEMCDGAGTKLLDVVNKTAHNAPSFISTADILACLDQLEEMHFFNTNFIAEQKILEEALAQQAQQAKAAQQAPAPVQQTVQQPRQQQAPMMPPPHAVPQYPYLVPPPLGTPGHPPAARNMTAEQYVQQNGHQQGSVAPPAVPPAAQAPAPGTAQMPPPNTSTPTPTTSQVYQQFQTSNAFPGQVPLTADQLVDQWDGVPAYNFVHPTFPAMQTSQPMPQPVTQQPNNQPGVPCGFVVSDPSLQGLQPSELDMIARGCNKPVHALDSNDVRRFVKRRRTVEDSTSTNPGKMKHPKIKDFVSDYDKDKARGDLRIQECGDTNKLKISRESDVFITLPMWLKAAERIKHAFYMHDAAKYEIYVKHITALWGKSNPKSLLHYDDEFRRKMHFGEHLDWSVPDSLLFNEIVITAGASNKNKNDRYKNNKNDDHKGDNKHNYQRPGAKQGGPRSFDEMGQSTKPCWGYNHESGNNCTHGARCKFAHVCNNPKCLTAKDTKHPRSKCPRD